MPNSIIMCLWYWVAVRQTCTDSSLWLCGWIRSPRDGFTFWQLKCFSIHNALKGRAEIHQPRGETFRLFYGVVFIFRAKCEECQGSVKRSQQVSPDKDSSQSVSFSSLEHHEKTSNQSPEHFIRHLLPFQSIASVSWWIWPDPSGLNRQSSNALKYQFTQKWKDTHFLLTLELVETEVTSSEKHF